MVLIAPPGINEPQRLQFQVAQYKELASGQLERTDATQSEYADACVRIGKEVGVPTLDLRSLKARADWPELQSDGLHMSAAGQKAIWHELRPLVDSLLGPVRPLPPAAPFSTHCLSVLRVSQGYVRVLRVLNVQYDVREL